MARPVPPGCLAPAWGVAAAGFSAGGAATRLAAQRRLCPQSDHLCPWRHNMMWMVPDPTYKSVIDEIERQTDRGAALIATALLEQTLVDLIRSKIIYEKDTFHKLFKPSGPIGDFSAKIDLGRLLGLYDSDTSNLLHTIREIRNTFAHAVKPIDFRSRDIRKRCEQLIRDQTAIDKMENALKEILDLPNTIKIGEQIETPRERFLTTVKVLLLIFGVAVAVHRSYGTPTSP